MRTIRLSQTFNQELASLLEQGLPKFGPRIVAQTSNRVRHIIEHFLVHYPVRTPDPVLGICAYPVTGVPFVILYDYDESELRIHLVIHASAGRKTVRGRDRAASASGACESLTLTHHQARRTASHRAIR